MVISRVGLVIWKRRAIAGVPRCQYFPVRNRIRKSFLQFMVYYAITTGFPGTDRDISILLAPYAVSEYLHKRPSMSAYCSVVEILRISISPFCKMSWR